MCGEQAASPDKKESAMLLTKSRVLVTALSVAAVAGAVALGFGSSYVNEAFRPAVMQAATEPAPSENPLPVSGKPAAASDSVRVEAPSTRVDVNKDSGKVRVKAPHTQVQVDPDQGRVRVRAPYVNLDIRW
jgi:hypothetical protein